jgi:hypothetical protein
MRRPGASSRARHRDRGHLDDSPGPGRQGSKTGRLWAFLGDRDNPSSSRITPPTAAATDRSGFLRITTRFISDPTPIPATTACTCGGWWRWGSGRTQGASSTSRGPATRRGRVRRSAVSAGSTPHGARGAGRGLGRRSADCSPWRNVVAAGGLVWGMAGGRRRRCFRRAPVGEANAYARSHPVRLTRYLESA